MSRTCALVAILLGGGLAGELALHLFEPRLALSWSYAHLGRHPALPALACVLVVACLALVPRAWCSRPSREPLRPVRSSRVVALGLAGWVGVAVLGLLYPVRPISIDPVAFLGAIDKNAVDNGRWHLLLWTLGHLAEVFRPLVRTPVFLRILNAGFATVALVALAGCARRLARSRGEAVAITALAWSAFGVCQLAIGYLDIYPSVLAFATVYMWLGLAVLGGGFHPVWAFVVGAIAPFWYIGLALLAPSLIVIAAGVLRRAGGTRRLAGAAGAALAVAGLATIPRFGRPFAWGAFVKAAAAASDWGDRPNWARGPLLPWHYVLTGTHLRELAHTFLLIDGVGVLLAAGAGLWLVCADPEGRRAPAFHFLLALAATYLAYVVVMDPVFGAFGDWDLFSYGAAFTSLVGGYAFIRWGRACPRPFAVVLALALATAGVHLLARLNALDVELTRHMAESPDHIR